MRDITAQLESYQDHLDAMYPAVTREEILSVYLESEVGAARSPIPVWRRAFAFGYAFLLILALGVIGFLLGGREAADLADDVAPTVISTMPPSTSAPPSTTMELAGPLTTVPSTPLPSTPDSLSTTVPAAILADGFTWQTLLAIDPEGGFAAAYFSEIDDAVTLLRCTDFGCSEASVIVLPGTGSVADEQHGELVPLIEDLVLDRDGSPIVMVSGETPTIHTCADPDCTSIETSVFGESDEVAAGTPRLAIARDGLPRIAYADMSARAVKLAVCRDPLCEIDSRVTVTIHDDILIAGEVSIRIEADGRLFVGYETMREDRPFQATIAVCSDDACSTEPVLFTFDDAVKPRWTRVDDGGFLAWYRSGPEIIGEGDLDVSALLDGWDLMVAECDDVGCGEGERIEVGWDLLMAWGGFRSDLRLLETPSDQVFAVYGYWSPDRCAQLIEVVTLEPQSGTMGTELGTYVGGRFAASATSDTKLLVVYQGAEGELHVVEVPAMAPGPADGDLPLPEECPTP